MLKRSLKFAIGPSLGVALGHVIISRVIYPHLYNETGSSILGHAGMSLIVSYIVAFLVSLIIEWVRSKLAGGMRKIP